MHNANVSTVISGLSYVLDLISEALHGHRITQDQQVRGPFAQRLSVIAAIADGAEIQDVEKVQGYLFYLFGFLPFLQGGFYSSMWDILTPVHEQVAAPISEEEAKVILHEAGEMHPDPLFEARLGHLHLLLRNPDDPERWKTYDATFLSRPLEGEEYRFADYEVRALAESRRMMYARRKEMLA